MKSAVRTDQSDVHTWPQRHKTHVLSFECPAPQADESDSDGIEFTPSDDDIQLVDDLVAYHLAEARDREQQNDLQVRCLQT